MVVAAARPVRLDSAGLDSATAAPVGVTLTTHMEAMRGRGYSSVGLLLACEWARWARHTPA